MSSKILYTRNLTRLLIHGKSQVTCYRYFSTVRKSTLGIQRTTISSSPTLRGSSESNVRIQNSHISHSSEKEIALALSRLDLDLSKHGHLNKEDLESIVTEIQKKKAITSSQGLYLIRCCGNLLPEELFEERNNLVQKIWELLLNLEVPLEITHFNSLLRIYLENEHSFNPLRFLSTLVEREIQPDQVTYQRLLIAYSQKGDLEGATKILNILKHKELVIDYRIYNAIVMGHSMIGDWEGAKSIISSMSEKGLTPDTETYRELLKGYAKFGICFAISSSLENWKKMNISFSDGDLLVALYKAAVHGHSEAVDVLLSRMKKDRDYNRSCVNIILQLVTQRKEDEAFKILLSMKPKRKINGKVPGSGRFFIRHIFKTNCSPDKIVEFCRKLVQTEKNSRAFFLALEAANIFERIELIDPLLNEIKDGGSYANLLGSILASGMQSGGEKKLIDTLRKMAAIRLYPNVQTINKHILPHLAGDSQTLLQKLRSARLSFPAISVALLQKSLASLDFNEAIRITSTFYISMNSRLYEDIATAYVKSQNTTGLARLMNSLLPDGEEDETKNEAMDLSSQIIGSVLKEICEQTPSGQLEVIEPLLESLRDQGLTISLSVAQFVRDKASENKMTSAVVDLLAELTSGKLIPAPLNPTPKRLQLATISQAEKNIAKFRAFAREHKLDEALAVKKELDAHNVPFSVGLNLLLIDLYGHHGRLDEALDVFSRIHKNPDLIVLPSKIMILSARLLKGGRIDDAIRVLEKLKIDPRVAENIELTRSVNASAIRLMDAAAENGNVETIQKIFDCLEQSKALKMSRALLGSLVKVHVVRDDLDSALDEFDRWTKERRTTPWNTQLAANLIEKDDTARLDRLMRMNTAVHGEKNSLFDLSLAFLSCQRVRDAKNILETPGLRIVNRRLDNVCAFYVRRKKLDELENLVKITKNVFNVDRHMLYDHLLAACIKVDDPKRATNIWTLMQEEGDLVPDSGFLRRLGDFLTTKKMLVPFSVPPNDQVDEFPGGWITLYEMRKLGVKASFPSADINTVVYYLGAGQTHIYVARSIQMARILEELPSGARRKTLGHLFPDIVDNQPSQSV